MTRPRPFVRESKAALAAIALLGLYGCDVDPQSVFEAIEEHREGRPPSMGHPGEAVRSLGFIGLSTLPKELKIAESPVGGLSGLVRQGDSDTYFAVCDDPSAGRFFRVTIDVADGRLDQGDIAVDAVTFPKDPNGQAVAAGAVDLEGIGLDADGRLWISSEGIAPSYSTFIRKYELDGRQVASLPVDAFKFDPTTVNPNRGVRPSAGFESLSLTADRQSLFVATERALLQDGADTTFTTTSAARITKYDLRAGLPTAERVYMVDARTIESTPPGGQGSRGLVEILAISDRHVLALEREFAAGTTSGEGTRPVRLYEVDLDGDEVLARAALDGSERPVHKRLLLDFEELRRAGLAPRIGSMEGLAWGPTLADGRRVLFVVEDSDFERPTQVMAFALALRR